jgi:DNA-binding response OmpR family regulator
MLVNDDVNVCDRTATMLTILGWDVFVVAANELLNDHSKLQVPQLVLVDIEMRNGTGFDLILKARRRFKDAFIIAATRGSDRDLWPGLIDMCGADRYLVGPVSKTKLVKQIDAAVSRGQLGEPATLMPANNSC